MSSFWTPFIIVAGAACLVGAFVWLVAMPINERDQAACEARGLEHRSASYFGSYCVGKDGAVFKL